MDLALDKKLMHQQRNEPELIQAHNVTNLGVADLKLPSVEFEGIVKLVRVDLDDIPYTYLIIEVDYYFEEVVIVSINPHGEKLIPWNSDEVSGLLGKHVHVKAVLRAGSVSDELDGNDIIAKELTIIS
ncbi:MAG: hypothetical protein LBT37_06035 [Lactobacillaceae bacterium]|jgi:hypothetical protein|nr:hypothetical protein [Lactobacillaceae bacterium]